MTRADRIFSKAGLAVFLTSTSGDHDPRVPVYIGDHRRPVYITGDDLRCPSCGAFHDTPDRNPAKWLAANTVLNDGLCGSCSGS